MFWKEVFADRGRGGWVGRLLGAGVVAVTFVIPLIITAAIFADLSPWVRRTFELTPSGRPFDRRWADYGEAMNGWVRGATGVLGTLALLAAAVRGAGAVTGERDRDTWVSLLSAPLTAAEIGAGKWWGAVLGVRRLVGVIVVVWAWGLAAGGVHPLAVPGMAASLAVYLAAFAGLGLWCSAYARTTLIATVRAIFLAGFAAGGFWLAVMFCCVLPVQVAFRPRGGGPDVLEQTGAQMLLGATPPIVLGWAPLREFTPREMAMFSWHRGYGLGNGVLGPLAPLLGLAVWAMIGWGTAAGTYQRLKELTNRRWE